MIWESLGAEVRPIGLANCKISYGKGLAFYLSVSISVSFITRLIEYNICSTLISRDYAGEWVQILVPVTMGKMVTSLVATLSWNMVPRNKQTPNTDKVVMENYIPVLTLLLPRRVDSNSTSFLNFHVHFFSTEMFWKMPGDTGPAKIS